MSMGGGDEGTVVSPSSSDHQQQHPRIRTLRSCLSCRSRKIKCDKSHPCAACQKSSIQCFFPEQGRRQQRSRKPDSVLLERLARLESLIGELSTGGESGKVTAKGGQHQQRRERGSGRGSERGSERGEEAKGRVPAATVESCTSSTSDGASPESPAASTLSVQQPGADLGRLVTADGRSRYISPTFWATVSEEVEDLKLLLQETIEREEEEAQIVPCSACHNQHILRSPFFFRSGKEDLAHLHPSTSDSSYLYSVFVYAVDPLVRILHKPTFERKLAVLQQNRNATELPRGFEALVFAVYFAAVTSMQPETVISVFGIEKEELLQRYRLATEQALANARFLQSEELNTLQAFVLFVQCLRSDSDTRTVWTLVGLLIRIAQSLGLHRDGSHFTMTLLEIEIRRRIWYEICLLDLRTAEAHGSDPKLFLDISFDTRLPLNLDDEDLELDLGDGEQGTLVEKEGFTEMTFSLLRFELMVCFRYLLRSSTPHSSGSGSAEGGGIEDEPPSTTPWKKEQTILSQKEAFLEKTRERLESKYFKNVDLSVPLQRVAFIVAKIMMGRAVFHTYHTLRCYKGGELLNERQKKKLFITAIESLEYGRTFSQDATTHNYIQWNWLFQKFTQVQAVIIVLAELAKRPMAEGSDEEEDIERAWRAVDGYYVYPGTATTTGGGGGGGEGGVGLGMPNRRVGRVIGKLRDRAWKNRVNAAAAAAAAVTTTAAPENCGDGGLDVNSTRTVPAAVVAAAGAGAGVHVHERDGTGSGSKTETPGFEMVDMDLSAMSMSMSMSMSPANDHDLDHSSAGNYLSTGGYTYPDSSACAGGGGGGGSGEGEGEVMDMDGFSLDWNEWDNMFQYVRMDFD